MLASALDNAVRDLRYDAADRIVSYTHYDASTGAAKPTLDQRFSYDELGRLKNASMGLQAWGLDFDAIGEQGLPPNKGKPRSGLSYWIRETRASPPHCLAFNTPPSSRSGSSASRCRRG